jgi:phosphoglycolate phosphatase
MTDAPGPELAQLLARTRCLLLDFDGPVCAVFAGRPARTIVLELLDLVPADHTCIPQNVANSHDPFDVLRYASTVSAELLRAVEQQLCAAELDAVRSARPTPLAASAIRSWRRAGRPVAIVSNNSEAAVQVYLAAHAIELDLVVARTSPDPALLKPSPYLVTRAVRDIGADPETCTLVGDSPSDIVAARRAGTNGVGYANKPGKRRRLADAGAAIVIDDMRALAQAASHAAA